MNYAIHVETEIDEAVPSHMDVEDPVEPEYIGTVCTPNENFDEVVGDLYDEWVQGAGDQTFVEWLCEHHGCTEIEVDMVYI